MLFHRRLQLIGAVLLASGAIATAQTNQIVIHLTPPSTSLTAGQSTTFQATIQGTNVPGIAWSIKPALGTLTAGSATSTMDNTSATPIATVTEGYTAPSIINVPQAITLIASSLVDPTKTASATIYLGSSVGIAVTPTSATLAAGQSATFQASIGGTLNTSVSWSLNPPIGTITNGVYTAPAMINTITTVVLTVASLADPSKTAQAPITLITKPTSISISPTQVTLKPSQPQQFTATVQGASSSVSWSINPMVGNISPNGLYTPPSTVSEGQVVAVTATMASDPSKSATALVTLSAPTPPPPVPPIQLPVEVVGLDGMTSTVTFNIPQGSNLNGPIKLLLQIHRLRYQTQASLQINNSGWTPINDTTVTLLGNGAAAGGIGGGFSTLQMTMLVPLSAINIGTNTLTFRFNGTDGAVSGYRVLSFNLLAGDGSSLLPEAAFAYEDPNTWQPPSNLPSDIAAGKNLWYQASLTVPTPGGPQPIQAKCTSCHAQDGRDLKYFNYSNNSIRTRSMFHGLTAQQGDQIASYIRTLNVLNPGRPWNPPYQPGPGLDEQPVEQWSAGAGLKGILNSDQDVVNELFPQGVQQSMFDPNYNLNVRETAVALQFPDWNSWLPTVHPIDAWGSTFTNSLYNTRYSDIRALLKPGDPIAYANATGTIAVWQGNYSEFITPLAPGSNPDPNVWTPYHVQAVYSTTLWGLVKNWELNQEFGLEGMARSVFTNPGAESRAWYTAFPFAATPNGKIPKGWPSFQNGKVTSWEYTALVWYVLQLVLNNSEHAQNGNTPIDWGYFYGFIHGLSSINMPGQVGLAYILHIKALEISNNGIGPDVPSTGWSGLINDPSVEVGQDPAALSVWVNTSPAFRTALYTAWLRAFLNVVETFRPQQFWTGGWGSGTTLPVHGNTAGSFEDRVWYAIPLYRYFGVDQTLINEFANWAQSVWPAGIWSQTTTATCTVLSGGNVTCSTEQ
jgi:hypothetical protein